MTTKDKTMTMTTTTDTLAALAQHSKDEWKVLLTQYYDGKRHARDAIQDAWPYAARVADELRDAVNDSPYGEGVAVSLFYGMQGSGHLYVRQEWVESLHDKWSAVKEHVAPPPPPPVTREEVREAVEAFDASGADDYEPYSFEAHLHPRTAEQQAAVEKLRAVVSRWVRENPAAHGGAMAESWQCAARSGSLDPLRAWLRGTGTR